MQRFFDFLKHRKLTVHRGMGKITGLKKKHANEYFWQKKSYFLLYKNFLKFRDSLSIEPAGNTLLPALRDQQNVSMSLFMFTEVGKRLHECQQTLPRESRKRVLTFVRRREHVEMWHFVTLILKLSR